jgi:CheY-like chemotaxis protein
LTNKPNTFTIKQPPTSPPPTNTQSGLEATQAIRALGFNGLIIGLTGNALDDDVANFIKAGADCVFYKPFREEHLATLLGFIADHGCESSDLSHSLIKPDQKKFFP